MDLISRKVGTRVAIATLVAAFLARHGLKRKTLSKPGALAAFAVGFVSFSCSYRFGLTLIAFYYSSSKLTKYKGDEKRKLEANFEKESQRGRFQSGSGNALIAKIHVQMWRM